MCPYNSKFKTLNPNISLVWDRTLNTLSFNFWILTCPSSLNKMAFPLSMGNHYIFKFCTLNFWPQNTACLVLWMIWFHPSVLWFHFVTPRTFFSVEQCWLKKGFLSFDYKGSERSSFIKSTFKKDCTWTSLRRGEGCHLSFKCPIWMTTDTQLFRFQLMTRSLHLVMILLLHIP